MRAPARPSCAATARSRLGRDSGEIYRDLTRELGEPSYCRVDAPATPEQKAALARLTPALVNSTNLGGEGGLATLSHASGNGASLGGLKVVTQNAWFAARPSGTESIHKIYAESFRGDDHLQRLLADAQAIVDEALAAAPL